MTQTHLKSAAKLSENGDHFCHLVFWSLNSLAGQQRLSIEAANFLHNKVNGHNTTAANQNLTKCSVVTQLLFYFNLTANGIVSRIGGRGIAVHLQLLQARGITVGDKGLLERYRKIFPISHGG